MKLSIQIISFLNILTQVYPVYSFSLNNVSKIVCEHKEQYVVLLSASYSQRTPLHALPFLPPFDILAHSPSSHSPSPPPLLHRTPPSIHLHPSSMR